MSRLRFQITKSTDGYVAGPRQSLENPLGEGGEELHDWLVGLRTFKPMNGKECGATGPDDDVAAEVFENLGATIMGRHMFGGGTGPWNKDKPWHGWWGHQSLQGGQVPKHERPELSALAALTWPF